MRADAPFHKAVKNFKRRLIHSALEATQGNRTQAARLLGLQRTYLCRLIRELVNSNSDEAKSDRSFEQS